MHVHAARSRTSASRSSRAARSRTSSSPATRTISSATPGLPADHQPVLRAVRREPAGRRRRPARRPGTYDIVFDTRSDAAARPVHVPLLGERHDAATAAAASPRHRSSIVVSITDARLGRRPAVAPGHARRPRAQCTSRTGARRPRAAAARISSLSRCPTTRSEEHGGRREGQARTRPSRPGRCTSSRDADRLSLVGLVDRRQRGQVPLDRADESSSSSSRKLSSRSGGRPAAWPCASPGHDHGARSTPSGWTATPPGCSDEHSRGDEQHDRERAHA